MPTPFTIPIPSSESTPQFQVPMPRRGIETLYNRDETLQERTFQYDFALGERSPGANTIYNQLRMGQEQLFRERMVQENAQQLMRERQALLEEFLEGKQGQPLEPEELDFIMGLSSTQMEEFKRDPNTFMESEYASQLVNSALASESVENDPELQAESNAFPELSEHMIDTSEDYIAKQTVLERLRNDLSDRQGQQNVFWRAEEFLETMIPFKSWINLSNELTGMAPLFPSMPGENLKEQVDYLYSLPLADFQRVVTEAANGIAAANTLDALDFVDRMTQYSSRQEFADNLFGALDLLDVASLGIIPLARRSAMVARGARRTVDNVVDGVSPVANLRSRLSSLASSMGVRGIELPTITLRGGYFDEASMLEAATRLRERFVQGTVGRKARGMLRAVPTFFNPTIYASGGFRLVREAGERVLRTLQNNTALMSELLVGKRGIVRLNDRALAEALQQGVLQVRREYVHLNDAVIETRVLPPEGEDGVNTMEAVLGKPDGTSFESRVEASFFGRDQYGIDDKDFTIRGEGNAFNIILRRDLDETLDEVRDNLLDVDNTNPITLANVLGRLRSADDILSEAQRISRKIATHGPNEILRLVRAMAAPMTALKRGERKRMTQIFDADRRFSDPETGQEGTSYKTIAAFENGYFNRFGSYPSPREVEAYFSYQQLYDLDFVLRNIGLYRQKARLGMRQYRFNIPDSPLPQQTWFEGREVENTDWIFEVKDDSGFLFWEASEDVPTFVRRSQANPNEAKELLNELKEQGYRVIQVANPTRRPLQEISNTSEEVNFIVIKGIESKGLDYNQIPYKPGGHREYLENYYIVQPKIVREERVDPETGEIFTTRTTFEGERVALGFVTEAKAKKFAPRMEHARQLLRDNRLAELREYLPRNLPYTFNDFRSLFISTDPANYTPPLSLYDPLVHRAEGTKISENSTIWGQLQASNPGIEDRTNTGFNLYRDIDKEYAGQRDPLLRTIVEEGTEENPLYRFEDARQLDPFTTLSHATSTMMRNQFLDDYKTKSVEDFIQQYHTVMDVSLEELRRNPVRYFHEAPWKEMQGVDRDLLTSAKNARLAILNLLGTKTFLATTMDSFKGRILDSIYTKAGSRAAEWVDDKRLWEIKDPTRFIRSAAYQLKLGLFNPVQLFLQAQTFTHILALSPLNAPQAASAAWMMRFMPFTSNPRIISRFGDHASKLGWKKEDFMEMLEAYRTSGIDVVEGELGFLDDAFDPKVFRGKFTSFLDKGTGFFKASERFVRRASFAAAYREWKARNAFYRQDLVTVYRADAGNVRAPIPDYVRQTPEFQGTRDATGRWWSEHREEAEWYLANEYPNGTIKEMRVPRATVEASRISNLSADHTARRFSRRPDRELFLPRDVVQRGKRGFYDSTKLDDKAFAEIIQRQDILSNNMTRASNASWQRGLLSIPTQFFSYQLRMFEQLTGKRLTRPEKARLLITYGMMYGVPTQMGMMLPFWPWYEDIKQDMLQEGYNYSDNVLQSMLMEGMVGTTLKLVFGDSYNFGQRYGPGGLSIIKEAITGDKSFFEALFGAGGNVTAKFLLDTIPVWRDMIDILTGNEVGQAVLVTDLVAAFQEISSVSQATKAWYALSVGRYITRTGAHLDDVNTIDAIMTGILGLTPRDIADMNFMYESIEEKENAQRPIRTRAIDYLRRAFVAENREDFDAYLRRARHYLIGGGFTETEIAGVFAQAADGYESDLDTLMVRFMRDAPAQEQQQRQEYILNRMQERARE